MFMNPFSLVRRVCVAADKAKHAADRLITALDDTHLVAVKKPVSPELEPSYDTPTQSNNGGDSHGQDPRVPQSKAS